jgi:hypothetical protein
MSWISLADLQQYKIAGAGAFPLVIAVKPWTRKITIHRNPDPFLRVCRYFFAGIAPVVILTILEIFK